jgi:hypothetical protein
MTHDDEWFEVDDFDFRLRDIIWQLRDRASRDEQKFYTGLDHWPPCLRCLAKNLDEYRLPLARFTKNFDKLANNDDLKKYISDFIPKIDRAIVCFDSQYRIYRYDAHDWVQGFIIQMLQIVRDRAAAKFLNNVVSQNKDCTENARI